MKKNIIPVCAYTPPPNGILTVDGISRRAFPSFHTKERYAEYRACGFDEILFAGEDKYQGEEFATSETKKMMDLSEACGLRAIVFDERIISLTVRAQTSIAEELFAGDTGAFYAFVADCLAPYRDHPAFYGVSVIDEPFVSKAGVIAEITQAVKAACPSAFLMTCFLPCVQDMGLVPGAFGEGYDNPWDAYRNYIDKMSVIGYFHYDCYPFGFWEGKNVVAHKFIENMRVAAEESNRIGTDFHMTVQSFSSGRNDELRRVDFDDVRWQTNLALMFGAKKIYYFTYWRFSTRPSDNFTSAIMDDDGTPICYDAVKRGNELLQKTARYLFGAKYLSTSLIRGGHENDSTEDLQTTACEYIVDAHADADILVNTLEKDGRTIIALLNLRDPYEKEKSAVSLTLASFHNKIQTIIHGELSEVATTDGRLNFCLAPGEAVYFYI